MPIHRTIQCPKCKKGDLIETQTSRGVAMTRCSEYPTCDYTGWGEPVEIKCDKCGAEAAVRQDVYTKWSVYCPICKNRWKKNKTAEEMDI